MQKCSKMAYSMCPDRHLCGPIDDAIFTDSSECAVFNKDVQNNPLTNGDRIRSMSDDDLCELLMGDAPCDWIPCSGVNGRYNCGECVLQWLQQPAEGG